MLNRRTLVVLLAALCLQGCYAQGGKRVSVAVLPFENQTGEPAQKHWGMSLCRSISGSLHWIASVRPLSTWRVEGALKERHIHPGSPISAEDARHIHTDLDADVVVWGSYRKVERGWQVSARWLSQDKVSAEVQLSGDDWYEFRDRLTTALLTDLQIAPSNKERVRMQKRFFKSAEAYECDSKADAAYEDHDYALAVRYAKRVTEKEPNVSAAWLTLAYVLEARGRHTEALQAAKKSVNLDSQYDGAHYCLGYVLFEQRQLEGAIREFRQAVSLDSTDAESLHRLGEALFDNENLEEAVQVWREAIELDPDFAEVHAHLGMAYLQQGKRSEALEALRTALKLDPHSPSVHWMLSEAYHGSGETELAVQHLERYVELESETKPESVYVGRARKRLEEMKASMKPAFVTANAPAFLSDPYGGVSPKELHRRLRQKLSEKEVGELINPLDSNQDIDQRAKEILADAKTDMEKAKALFDHLNRRARGMGHGSSRTAQEVFAGWERPDQTFVCVELAALYVAMARSGGLKAYLVDVDKDVEGRPVYHACAAVVIDGKVLLVDLAYRWFGVRHKKFQILDDVQTIAYHQTARRAPLGDRLELCRIAVKLFPDSAWVQAKLAESLAEDKQFREAEAAIKKALELDAEHPEVHHVRGTVLAGQGKVEEAAAALRESIHLNPEDHNAHLELAKLLAEHNRAQEALLEFEALSKHDLDDEMAQEVKDSVERLKRKMLKK